MSELNVGGLVATLEVEARDWDRELRDADAELRRAADKAEGHLDRIGDSFRDASKEAARSSADIGDSMQRMADRVSTAQTRLSRAHERERDALAEVIRASDALDFARIGGDTDKVTAATKRLDDALRGAAAATRGVSSASKDLTKVQDEMRKAGEDAGKELGKGASSTISKLGPLLAPAAVLAGAAAAEGIVLGFGAGLIGIGVLSAKSSQHVKDEWTEVGDHIKSRSKDMFRPYADSLLDVAHITKATFDGFAPALDRSADRLAPALTRFSQNVSKALLNLEPAIDPMSRAAEKVMDSFGGRLPSMMARLERGMHSLADSISENPEALADLAEGAGAAAEGILKLLGALNRAYGPARDTVTWLTDLNDKIVELTGQDDRLKWDKGLKDTDVAAQGTAEALDVTRRSAEELAAAQEQAERAAQAHADALERLQDVAYGHLSAELALREAIDSADESVQNYTDSVKEHGARSEEASDSLRDLEGASLQVAEAARENAYAQQAAAGRARDQVGANAAARDALLQLAGTLRGPARDAVMAQVAALDALIGRLRSVPGTYAAKVQITVSTVGRYTGPPIGAMPAFARGGNIGPGEMGRVAETEPEVLDTGSKLYLMMPPGQGGRITPMSELGGGGTGPGSAGGGDMRVVFDGRGLSGLDRAVWDWLQSRVHVVGGGDVQRALGRRR